VYNKNMKLKIKKLTEDAILPSYAHKGDAGLDLYANEEVVIWSGFGQPYTIKTGISMQIPEGCVGLIWEKSGLAEKYGFSVMGGVIDSTYRGEIIVLLKNSGTVPVRVEKGRKIAQLLIQPVESVTVEEVNNLNETKRGKGGFGSTGDV
jgi:dUTP pyrophosphatase